jgi:hypothetical protein
MNKVLGLEDIIGYLPHGVYLNYMSPSGFVRNDVITGYSDNRKFLIVNDGCNDSYIYEDGSQKLVLRPLSDLYKPIIHNGEKFISIVKLAEKAYPWNGWYLDQTGEKATFDTDYEYVDFFFNGRDKSFVSTRGSVPNQYLLFDYLNELKIDYRGLIDAGLAIDVNTLENNPYK